MARLQERNTPEKSVKIQSSFRGKKVYNPKVYISEDSPKDGRFTKPLGLKIFWP